MCWVYQDAMAAGKLLPSQMHIGEAAKAFLKALTPDTGHPALVDHFREVLALMRGSRNWREFYTLLNRSLPRFDETIAVRRYAGDGAIACSGAD